MSKKILVVGGGGAKGAYAVGLLTKFNKSYDKYYGTSTGALIAPLVALGKYEELKEAYLSLNNKSIYSVNPFNKKGKLSKFNIIKRALKKENSFGESDNLKKLIRKYYTEEDHKSLRIRSIEVIVTVTNMTTNKTGYISNLKTNYESFVECIWTSTLAYPFTGLNGIFADGGYSSPVPIVKACKDNPGANIDVIVLDTEKDEKFNPNGLLDAIPSIINELLRTLFVKDKGYANHLSKENNIKINYYYTPYSLTENSMRFDKTEMKDWFKLGNKI